jgi:hypothetical protein
MERIHLQRNQSQYEMHGHMCHALIPRLAGVLVKVTSVTLGLKEM